VRARVRARVCAFVLMAVHQQLQEYPNSVEFLFVRTGVTNADGHNTRQFGKEWVCFTLGPGGQLAISRVAVETNKTDIISSVE